MTQEEEKDRKRRELKEIARAQLELTERLKREQEDEYKLQHSRKEQEK